MTFNEDSHKSGGEPMKRAPDIFSSPDNIIAIYTVLSVLLKMRSVLGLEAMIDYIEKYLRSIEVYNPEMRQAVNSALKLINVKKIYDDAMR